MEIALALAISELLFKHGVPAGLEIVKAWDCDDEPTMEDIKRLKEMVPLPGTFFEGEAK